MNDCAWNVKPQVVGFVIQQISMGVLDPALPASGIIAEPTVFTASKPE
jgi:hypothetical protein